MCQSWELVYGFADLRWSCDVWVSGFRNRVKYKGFVCKQLKKTVISHTCVYHLHTVALNLKLFCFLCIAIQEWIYCTVRNMQIEANTSNIGTKNIYSNFLNKLVAVVKAVLDKTWEKQNT